MAVRTQPAGVNTHWFWGAMQDFNRDSLKFLLDVRKFGDVVQTRFGPFRVYFLNHPDVIHHILVEDNQHMFKSRVTKRVLEPVVGNGLFTNDGESWKRQRRLAQPAFHTKRIGAYADIMSDYAAMMVEAWHDEAQLEIDLEMTALTMRIIAKTLFDADVSGEEREVGDAITDVLSTVNTRFNRLIPRPDWLPTEENRKFRRDVQRLDVIIQRFIDERRASGEDKGDLLSMLLLALDDDGSGGMTDKQVRDEAMTLFGAGHETTANALTWTLYALSQNPEVEARLHAELDAVLGGRRPTLEDLRRLPYTEMVVKESMRLYPPAWAFSREPNEDVVIDGVPVRKGDTIMVNIFGMHRDARFFPDPERFDPERFSPENEKSIPKYAYLPFGGGPRVCIGNAFAMMEARLILATIAQHFTLDVAPGHKVVPERVFTLRPKYGMKMIARKREPVPAPENAL